MEPAANGVGELPGRGRPHHGEHALALAIVLALATLIAHLVTNVSMNQYHTEKAAIVEAEQRNTNQPWRYNNLKLNCLNALVAEILCGVNLTASVVIWSICRQRLRLSRAGEYETTFTIYLHLSQRIAQGLIVANLIWYVYFCYSFRSDLFG